MLGAIIEDTVGSHYEFHNTKDYHAILTVLRRFRMR